MIEKITIKEFTAFNKLNLSFEKGVNVIIGANNTGKSHLLKLLYVLCASTSLSGQAEKELARSLTDKLNGVFKPEDKLGRLCRNDADKSLVRAEFTGDLAVEFAFSNDMDKVAVTENKNYKDYRSKPVFIPPKEVISSFPGFSSLYLQREISFDETYFDLCQALETPKLRETPDDLLNLMLDAINKSIDGEFILMKQKRFYYKPKTGRMIEAELAAEGFRKLGMLQILLQNGRIQPGVSGPLFWDEPESNLNPSLMYSLVDILLNLSRAGQSIFLASHDYVLLKWFDLLRKPEDNIVFHSFFKDKDSEVAVNSTSDYLKIHPNPIDKTYADLIDKEIKQSMGGLGT